MINSELEQTKTGQIEVLLTLKPEISLADLL